MRTLLLLAALAACDTGETGGGDAAVDAAVELLGSPCAVDIGGTLPGVSIHVASESCVYRQGTAARFTYTVTTTAAVPAIDVPDSGSCDCDYRTTAISSWTSWSIRGTSSNGDPQQYCLCDTGCCGPQNAQTITPLQGTFDDVIAWSGHTWDGPSDTGNSEGPAFERGNYGVTVRFEGYAMGFVEATLPIEIR